MAFSKYGKVRKFPRNENVEVHVRDLTLLPDTADEKQYIEVREFIKSSGLYGHGIVLPLDVARVVAADITSRTEGE